MVNLTALVSYLAELLKVTAMDDYCPNGLQVEGGKKVKKIITGVTASQQLIDCAIERGADAIIVHHGYFWKGENPCLTGLKKKRLQTLLAHEVSLLAYHLPLDVHPELGNNVQLAKVLGWEPLPGMKKNGRPALLRQANLSQAYSGANLFEHLTKSLGRKPLHIEADKTISKVAWCTGAAQSYIAEAAEMGVDAYITGEISEQTVHEAREYGIHFYAAGHHAIERYGVKALGNKLVEQFGVSCEFIDCDNPV